MDYCSWDGVKCQYEDRYWRCDFHQAFVDRDYGGMVAALQQLITDVNLKGVKVAGASNSIEGRVEFTVVATPDSSGMSTEGSGRKPNGERY